MCLALSLLLTGWDGEWASESKVAIYYFYTKILFSRQFHEIVEKVIVIIRREQEAGVWISSVKTGALVLDFCVVFDVWS